MAACKTTILNAEHRRHGARMIDFQGWELPVQYTGILAEHRQCRTAAALFDTCHMSRFLIEGQHAATDLARLLTCDIAGMPVGKCRYGLLLDEQAGILDDTITIRLDANRYLVVGNAGTARRDFTWIQKHLSRDTALTDRSAAWGKIDLQGPAAYRVLSEVIDDDFGRLAFFCAHRREYCGREVIVSRTGYTGELGYEIFMPADGLPELFTRLTDHEAVAPAGLGARDLLRLEMNYPLYGAELDPACNPVEADLERFVARDREFIGVEALRAIDEHGVARKLVAFRCDSRRRPVPGSDIARDGQRIGKVTSGAFSPALETAMGMGYVAVEHAVTGTELEIRMARNRLTATVQAKPLYKHGTCRIKSTELAS